MNIEEIKKNAPYLSNYYKYISNERVVYYSARTRHIYKWTCKNKWAGNWYWERLIDYNDTSNLIPL